MIMNAKALKKKKNLLTEENQKLFMLVQNLKKKKVGF